AQPDLYAENEARAALRSSSIEKLHRTLQGDVDTILLKALKKEPRERYASVSLFASDLRRYLECEPIGARLPWYSSRCCRHIAAIQNGAHAARSRTAPTLQS